jgi:hypothetical protein
MMGPMVTFKTHFFKIRAGEDEKINPGIYGEALAKWLVANLEKYGYEADILDGEDWGWMVPILDEMPFSLFLGCADMAGGWEIAVEANTVDAENLHRFIPIGGDKSMLIEIDRVNEWGVFIAAEIPVFRRIFKRIDPLPEIKKLEQCLRELIPTIPGVSDIQWEKSAL